MQMTKSLRTKDNLVVGNIFNEWFHTSMDNYETLLLNNNKIITTNIFHQQDCSTIIANSQKYGFQKKDGYTLDA
jgi:hypothetical protein